MSTASGARTGARTTVRQRTAAQLFCLVVGATLVVVGLLGFLVESKFDTSSGGDPGALDGEKLILL